MASRYRRDPTGARGLPGAGLRLAQFIALVLTALALVPAGAHLAALPGKIDLPAEAYFMVQSIYSGWSLFGIALIGALLANLVLALALWRQRWPCRLALAGFALTSLTLAVFFIRIYPANQATANWTVVPAGWEALRAQWEYAHALNAGLAFLAFCCIVLATLRTRA